MMATSEIKNYLDFVKLVGHPPPKMKCPGGSLSDKALERLKDRPDLIDWALGR